MKKDPQLSAKALKLILNKEVLGEELIPHLLPHLDIHDALIVATGLLKQQSDTHEVCLLTRDQKIKKEAPLTVVWD